jgi:hypothetical protein
MSATSPTTKDTTAAILVGLPFATVRGIVETMQRAFPAEYDRIGRGLQVLLASKIVDSPRTGCYLVQSTTDGYLFYESTTLGCSCPDHRRNPETRCKHSWALDILSVASAIQAREQAASAAASVQDADILDVDPDAAIPFEITAQGLAALDAPLSSGEAACPRCGRVRGVVFDGDSTRCFGCHRHWTPTQPAPSVA